MGGGLPHVEWVCEGEPILIDPDSWQYRIGVEGFDTFTGRAPDPRKVPSQLDDGAEITGFLSGGEVVWQGTCDAKPQIDENGLAVIGATGPAKHIAERNDRMFYKTIGAGGAGFTDGRDPPYDYATRERIGLTIKPASLIFRIERDVAYAVNDRHVAILWMQGGTIGRVKGTIERETNATNAELLVGKVTGPSGAIGSELQRDLATGALTFDVAISSPTRDGIVIGVQYNAAQTPTTTHIIRVRDLEIWGLRTTDQVLAHEVMQDIGTLAGFDVSGVQESTLDVLPLDWDAPLPELLQYMALLLDWTVLAVERSAYDRPPQLVAGPWETRWEASYGYGLTGKLKDDPLYSHVLVEWENESGEREELLLAADPNPLPDTGTRVYPFALEERHRSGSNLPLSAGSSVLNQVSVLRYSGRLSSFSLHDIATGRNVPFLARPGTKVRVPDWDVNAAREHRIMEVEGTHNGVALGIETPLKVDRLVALRTLRHEQGWPRARKRPPSAHGHKRRGGLGKLRH